MKSHVVITNIAVIIVAQKHWPKIRTALALYHRERVKSYGESFHTHSRKCDLRLLGERREIHNCEARRAFWRRVRLEMPMNFDGEIVFECEC